MDKYYVRENTARTIVNTVGADDSDVKLVVKYVGAEQSCLVSMATNNTMTFKTGVLAAEAVDANVGTAGVIDLTNASYNTMGELVDYINGLTDYQAYLVGSLRADDADVAGAMVTATDQQAKTASGYAFKGDTSVALCITSVISSRGYNNGTGNDGGDFGKERAGAINTLYRMITEVTFTGADTTSFYSINDNGTETLLFTKDYLTSGTESDINFLFGAGSGGGLEARPGERLLVRVAGASAAAIDIQFTLLGSTRHF